MQKKKMQGASPARNSSQYSSIDSLSRRRYMELETRNGHEISQTKESLEENVDPAIKENGMSSAKKFWKDSLFVLYALKCKLQNNQWSASHFSF